MKNADLNTNLSIEYRIEKAFDISEQFYEHYQKSGKDNTLKNLDNDLAKIVIIQEKIIERLDEKISSYESNFEKFKEVLESLKGYFEKNNLISFKNTPEKEEEILEETVKYFKDLRIPEELAMAYGQKLRVENRKKFIEKSRLQLNNENKIKIDEKTNELTGNDKIVFDAIINETFKDGKNDPHKRSEIFKKGITEVEGKSYKINPQLAVLTENEIQKQTKQQNIKSESTQTESVKTENDKKTPGHVNITDIHSDINHFITAMVVSGACVIGNPKIIYRDENREILLGDDKKPATEPKKGGTYYACPNLVFNTKYEGLLTFTGDLIQSHGALAVKDSIAIMLTMEAVMQGAKDAEKEGNIQYIAGNHEMESLNFTENPVVNRCVNRMVNSGQIKYCYYDEKRGIMFSHTVMNKKLICDILKKEGTEIALSIVDKIEKGGNEKLNTNEKKKLADILNKELSRPLVPEGAKQDQIDKIKNNIISSCSNLERCFEEVKFINDNLERLNESRNENFYIYLKDKGKENLEIVLNYGEVKEAQKKVEGLKNKKEPLSEEEKNQLEENIKKVKEFDEKKFKEAYAEIQINNPKARNIEIMNDGEMMNYSGGLYGYGDGKDTVNVGTQWVGHRPSLVQVGSDFQKADTVYDMNINGATVRQTDMLGKPDTSSTNLKMVVDGNPYVFSDLSVEDKKLAKDLGVAYRLDKSGGVSQETVLNEYIKCLDKENDKLEIDTIKIALENDNKESIQRAYSNALQPEKLKECEKKLLETAKSIEGRANEIVKTKQKNQQVIKQAVGQKLGSRSGHGV